MKSVNIIIVGIPHFNHRLELWCDTFPSKVCRMDLTEEITSTPGRFTSDVRSQIVSKLDPLTKELEEADMIFDTVSGPSDKKRVLLQEIEQRIPEGAKIFTSFLHHSATEQASWLQQPNRVVGYHPLHFDEMSVLECAPALQTSQEIQKEVNHFVLERKKKAEIITDHVGGIFPRTLALLVNEATFALAEEVATAEDIDIAMKKGTNYPLGPLEWADRVGLDHIYWILEGLHRDFGEDRYRPCPLLKKKVLARQLGLSTGEGYYQYD